VDGAVPGERSGALLEDLRLACPADLNCPLPLRSWFREYSISLETVTPFWSTSMQRARRMRTSTTGILSPLPLLMSIVVIGIASILLPPLFPSSCSPNWRWFSSFSATFLFGSLASCSCIRARRSASSRRFRAASRSARARLSAWLISRPSIRPRFSPRSRRWSMVPQSSLNVSSKRLKLSWSSALWSGSVWNILVGGREPAPSAAEASVLRSICKP